MSDTIAAKGPQRDVMMETWWPPAVMAAWVVWRTRDEAQKCWHVCWKEPTTLSNVFALEGFLRSFMESRDHVPAIAPGEQARDEIERVLQEGRLCAEGVIRGEVLSGPLPVSIWQIVQIRLKEPLEIKDWPRWHDALFREGDPEPIVTTARVLREDVMREWQDVYAAPIAARGAAEEIAAAKPTIIGKPKPASEAEVKRVLAGAPQVPPLKEAELIQYVIDKLSDRSPSRNSIYRLRKEYEPFRSRGEHDATLASRKSDKSDTK